jgi:hypothetical protein
MTAFGIALSEQRTSEITVLKLEETWRDEIDCSDAIDVVLSGRAAV